MTLSLLLDGKFDEYFAINGAGKPLWLFVHVPKTAGSSLFTELQKFLGPAQNINIDGIPSDGRSYSEMYDAAIDEFITRTQRRPHRFASGHLTEKQTSRIRKAVPEVRMFTMLRQPVSRVVSDYRYQRSSMHPGHEEFKKQMPTLAHYVEHQGESNKITKHLVPRPLLASRDEQGCIDFIMQNYVFVGMQEMYPLSFQTLSRLVGMPAVKATVKKRVNEVSEENPSFLTRELEQKIKDLNQIDMAIYEAFLKSIKAIREPLIEYIRACKKKEMAQPA